MTRSGMPSCTWAWYNCCQPERCEGRCATLAVPITQSAVKIECCSSVTGFILVFPSSLKSLFDMTEVYHRRLNYKPLWLVISSASCNLAHCKSCSIELQHRTYAGFWLVYPLASMGLQWDTVWTVPTSTGWPVSALCIAAKQSSRLCRLFAAL